MTYTAKGSPTIKTKPVQGQVTKPVTDAKR